MDNHEGTGKHTVTIEDRQRIKVNCVEDVESFNEEKVVVYTTLGVMIINGYNFKVSRLNVDDGQLIIDGEVDKVEYMETVSGAEPSGGFFGKLFR